MNAFDFLSSLFVFSDFLEDWVCVDYYFHIIHSFQQWLNWFKFSSTWN